MAPDYALHYVYLTYAHRQRFHSDIRPTSLLKVQAQADLMEEREQMEFAAFKPICFPLLQCGLMLVNWPLALTLICFLTAFVPEIEKTMKRNRLPSSSDDSDDNDSECFASLQ